MDDQLEIARNAGNVSELGAPQVAANAMKTMLASRIATALDASKLSVRAAADMTGFAAADYSRIRQGKLDRFTVDRLLAMLGKLEPAIELTLFVRPKVTRDWAIARLKEREQAIRAYGITGVSLFGSAARDEASPESDVDILVDRDQKTFDVLNLLSLRFELEEEIGVAFHVTDHQTLKPHLRDEIEREAVRVF